MNDVAARLKNRVQLTSDGHKPYLNAVEGAFGAEVDYAMLVKIYGSDPEAEKRYSPAKCIGCESKVVTGNPDFKHISTSYVERHNLSMRIVVSGRKRRVPDFMDTSDVPGPTNIKHHWTRMVETFLC